MENIIYYRHWYLERKNGNLYAKGYASLSKNTKGRTFARTDPINEVIIDDIQHEAIFKVQNTEFHCPLNSIDFSKQDLNPELIPNYKQIKSIYKSNNEKELS